MNKLFKIQISLTNKGYEVVETEWNVEEKVKIYKLSRIDEDGELIKRNLFKSSLNNIENTSHNYIYHISYTCVCQKSKIKDIKKEIYSKIEKTVLHFKDEVDNLLRYL